MSIIAPLNFLFAGLLGAIVLLYMLRLKRKERVVPSNLLWQSAIRDLQANAPWQKLRSSLLMWLQLAALFFLILALVRPAIKVLARGGQTVAIVLDSSASMNATDVSPSRFENARSQALKLINGLSSNDGATIISAGKRTKVLAPLSSDKSGLKRALSSAEAFDTGADLREAISLAASLLKDKKNPQIYVLSDGAVAPLQDVNVGKIGLQFVKVGNRSENLGITALDARRGYGGSNKAQVFATISNFSNRERTVNLELSRGADLLEVRPVTIPAAKTENKNFVPGIASELFNDLNFESGLFTARFDGDNFKDDLKSDNVAYARLDAPRRINVWLAADNLFLEKALNLDSNVSVFVGSNPAGREFDVVVCENGAPKDLPDTNQFLFNTQTPLAPVTVSGVVEAPSVADYDRQHPVARFAPWNDIRFAQSQNATLKPWGRAIVESERTPLIVAGERLGKRVVWCGFDLRESDLPLRVAFPIFVTNTLRWLSAPRGAGNASEGAPLRAGEPVPLLAPAKVEEIEVTSPDNSKTKIRRRTASSDATNVTDDAINFDGATQVGLYSAQSGKWSQDFAVSLLNKNESDLRPRQALQLNEKTTLQAENSARANRELWGYLIALALTILSVEWWIFHRGP